MALRGGGGRQSKIPSSSPFNIILSSSTFNDPHRRDSDASLASSRPSSAGPHHLPSSALLSDRSSQSAALRSINAYLSSLSAPFSLKPPLPSARDITDTLRLLLSRLELLLSDSPSPHHSNSDLDDLIPILKHLNCPIKLNRSALRAPGTPHSWPSLCSVIYWLVQLARYSDHLLSSTSSSLPDNDLLNYTARSYSLYISGEDDAVAEVDDEYLQKAEHQATNTAAASEALAKEAEDLEAKVSELKGKPSLRVELEKEKGELEEDEKKFESVIEHFKGQVGSMEGKLRDWGKELEAKERESKRMAEENVELKRRVEGQAVNVRDVERMRREMQAVERDIAEAEIGRNAMEEKAWELDAEVARKLKDLEGMAEQCNQAMKKLKLGNDLQYVINANGNSPAAVLGFDYKNILKPSLAAFAEDTKKASVSKLEELIALQQQSRENAAIIEEKRGHFAALQTKIDEAAARLNSLKKEIEEHASRCAVEAEKVNEEFTRKEKQLSMLEKEAEEFLKSSEKKLQAAIKETDEETQMCAHELLILIDEVSEYKEFMESMTSGIKTDVIQLAKLVGEAYNASAVSTKTVSTGLNPSLKRARPIPQSIESRTNEG